MKLTVILVDSVVTSADGTISALQLGVTGTSSPAYPALGSLGVLVLLEPEASDAGKNSSEFEVQFVAPDGTSKTQARGVLGWINHDQPGMAAVRLRPQLPVPGSYTVRVKCDGQTAERRFEAAQLKPPSTGPVTEPASMPTQKQAPGEAQ